MFYVMRSGQLKEHALVGDAMEEATRLCKKDGSDFLILKGVKVIKKTETPVVIEDIEE